jgi:aspartyl-tRNA(Asn)/glutamyl-tRNA(Gln) amidotransferase subunit A
MSAGSYGTWGKKIEEAPELMFPEILTRFRSGKHILAADYISAWARLRALRVLWEEKNTLLRCSNLTHVSNFASKLRKIVKRR